MLLSLSRSLSLSLCFPPLFKIVKYNRTGQNKANGDNAVKLVQNFAAGYWDNRNRHHKCLIIFIIVVHSAHKLWAIGFRRGVGASEGIKQVDTSRCPDRHLRSPGSLLEAG